MLDQHKFRGLAIVPDMNGGYMVGHLDVHSVEYSLWRDSVCVDGIEHLHHHQPRMDFSGTVVGQFVSVDQMPRMVESTSTLDLLRILNERMREDGVDVR